MKIFFAATIPESIMAKSIAPLAFTSFASGEFFHTKFSLQSQNTLDLAHSIKENKYAKTKRHPLFRILRLHKDAF